MNVERGAAINGWCYAHAAAWSTINAAVPRDAYANGAIQSAQRIYYQHDANFNTTAIVGFVNGTWQVTQRYIYDPYGNVTVLNADWTTANAVRELRAAGLSWAYVRRDDGPALTRSALTGDGSALTRWPTTAVLSKQLYCGRHAGFL